MSPCSLHCPAPTYGGYIVACWYHPAGLARRRGPGTHVRIALHLETPPGSPLDPHPPPSAEFGAPSGSPVRLL